MPRSGWQPSPLLGVKAVFIYGTVEKVRQRRSRPFVVLTYWVYAPLAKGPEALLNGPF